MIDEGGKSPSSTQSDKTKSVYFTSPSPNRRNNTTSLETVKTLYSSVCLTLNLGWFQPYQLSIIVFKGRKAWKRRWPDYMHPFSNTLKKIKNWTSFRQTGNLSQGRKSNNRKFFPFILYICHVIYVHHNNRRVIFVWPWKIVWVSVRYLFLQPMDEKSMKKTWSLRFLAKENPNMEKVLLDWSTSYRVAVCRQSEGSIEFWKIFGHEVFSPKRPLRLGSHQRHNDHNHNHKNNPIIIKLLWSSGNTQVQDLEI